jgi:hypothetical protein
VKHVEAFRGSLLVVQQVVGVLFCSGLVAVLEEMCNFVVDYIFILNHEGPINSILRSMISKFFFFLNFSKPQIEK